MQVFYLFVYDYVNIFWGYCVLGGIVKGIASLISFLVNLSIVYRRAPEFCELILYPVALLKVFINSRSFLMDFLKDLLCIKPYHLQIKIL